MVYLDNEKEKSWLITRYEIITFGSIQDLKITGRKTKYLSVSPKIDRAIEEKFKEDYPSLAYIMTLIETSEGKSQIIVNIERNRRKIKK